MFKKHAARVQLQGVPRLRARRAATRRDARREARKTKAESPTTGTKAEVTATTAEAKLDLDNAAKPPRIETMQVVAHDDGWALKVDDIAEPAWVVSKKRQAVKSAKENAMFHGAKLLVHTKSGKLQKTFAFGDEHAS